MLSDIIGGLAMQKEVEEEVARLKPQFKPRLFTEIGSPGPPYGGHPPETCRVTKLKPSEY